jgi:hypothetical protein
MEVISSAATAHLYGKCVLRTWANCWRETPAASSFLLVYTSTMPNGNDSITSSEWARIKAFFQKHSAVLLDFATDHNLAVDEYYHESPSWSFRFRHPKGGGASVILERLNDSTIRISGNWYIDEYETFTRHFKGQGIDDLLLDNIDLRQKLERNLNEVVSWEKSQMTPHPNYEKVWSLYSKEEWDKMFTTEHLPLLRQ